LVSVTKTAQAEPTNKRRKRTERGRRNDWRRRMWKTRWIRLWDCNR